MRCEHSQSSRVESPLPSALGSRGIHSVEWLQNCYYPVLTTLALAECSSTWDCQVRILFAIVQSNKHKNTLAETHDLSPSDIMQGITCYAM